MSTHNQCTSTSGNVKVIVRGKLKYRHKNIASLIDPKISMGAEAKDDFDTWAQDYALSVVLSGTNKYLSQAAIVHLYNSAFEGVKGYHDVLLGKIEKVALNEHNISSLQNSLLRAFKITDKTELNESPYQKLKNSFGKYYSIFNVGTQMFSMELNGMMVRTVDENFNIVNIPWSLSKIPGGSSNANKLCSQIMSVIGTVNNLAPSVMISMLKPIFLKSSVLRYQMKFHLFCQICSSVVPLKMWILAQRMLN